MPLAWRWVLLKIPSSSTQLSQKLSVLSHKGPVMVAPITANPWVLHTMSQALEKLREQEMGLQLL